jgi:outer membrane protein insertion porin family
VINNTLNYDQLDADVERLTAYYRRLGFFRARVSRTLDFSESEGWLTVTFIVDEGPRYRVRDLQVIGNNVFDTELLRNQLTLNPGDYFDMLKMSADVNALRDVYGADGYVTAAINAEPRFLEEPGELDLVYHIEEGDRYYVNQVLVNFQGDYPHTREQTVLNYVDVSPNDIVNMRRIRDSERRLKASQLFETNPAVGNPPTIRVVPSELNQVEQTASTLQQSESF